MGNAKRYLAGLTLVVTVLLSGCTLPDTPPPTPPSPPVDSTRPGVPSPPGTSGADTPLPVDQLERKLLTPEDLPGYQVTPSSGAGDLPSGDDQLDGCAALNADGVPDSATHAATALQKSALGPYISESLTSTSVRSATDAVDGLSDVVNSCGRFTTKMYSTTFTFTLSTLDFPAFGDQSAAFAMTGTAHGITITRSQVVAVRVGGVVILLINTVPVSKNLDSELTRTAVGLATAKVSR
jgi:hypothetical protein